MKNRWNGKRLLSLLMAFNLFLGLVFTSIPSAKAVVDWKSDSEMEYFLKKYSDSHFNLKNNPDSVMTIEEFIAILYAYSYYGDGSNNTPAKDKTGKQPSAWCAKYVQAEVDKKTVTPEAISWSDPVTIAFAAQFLSRTKGKYSYDSNNLYSFTGTSGLTADDILYCSVAVDYGLISYRAGMNVAEKIARKNVFLYFIPDKEIVCKAPIEAPTSHMKELHAYYVADVDDTQRQLTYLKEVKNDVTMVTVGCGYLQSGDNYLQCNFNKPETQEVLDLCHDNGKIALLGIINYVGGKFSSAELNAILSSDANINTFVNAIISQVEQHNFDGVNMGIEITANGLPMRQGYAKFLTKLSSALHSRSKVLMTTIGAYFTDQQQQESFYDYQTIGNVSDYIHVILYDDFDDTGYPYRKTVGTMSNLIRIGRVLRYCAVAMPKEKVLLGMGSFAIDYNTTKLQAQDIAYDDAMQLQRQYNAKTVADTKEDGVHFTYAESGNQHIVYFDTAETGTNRVKLANRYGLGGSSLYYVGSGNQEMFRVITGQSSFKPEIMQAMDEKLIPLSLRGNYDKAITRQEFCQLLYLFLETKSDKSMQQLTTTGASFTDTSDGAVRAISALGIVNGYGQGVFKPNQTITRQEAATMLTRLAKAMGLEKPNASSVTFSDFASIPTWFAEGVQFISACQNPQNNKRVMSGVGNNRFDPTGTYTREQSLMTLIRLYHVIKGQ